LGLFAAVANANSIHFYFSTSNDTGSVPTEWVTQTNPVVNSGDTVYLWATTNYPDIWNGVGMQFGSDDAGFAVDAGVMYNNFTKGWGQRWEDSSDFDPTGADTVITLVGVTTKGLGAYGDPDGYEENVGGGNYLEHNLVGEIAFSTTSGLGAIFLEASGGGIPMQGGTTQEDVYFGFGDDAIKNNSAKGTRTAVADLTFVPEPASLLLLSFAGLLLRRR